MADTTERPEYVLKAGAYFLSRNLKTWAIGISNAGRMTREKAEAIRETFVSQVDVSLHHESEFEPKKEDRNLRDEIAKVGAAVMRPEPIRILEEWLEKYSHYAAEDLPPANEVVSELLDTMKG